MKLQPTLIGLAASLLVAGATPALAQSKADFDALRDEIRQLRNELNALKQGAAAKPADASGWGDRIEQLEIKSKDAVVLGDIPGGFRLPGTETSVHLFGFAEAHAIHDIGRTAPDDNSTNLMLQPVGSEVVANPALGLKGRTKLTAQTSRFGFETATPTGAGLFNTKLEMDFYSYDSGNRNRLRLRHAYGEYAGFLIGQTWSTFMDLDDLPETVDFNGPIGAPFSRRTMIRYSYGDAKAGYKFTVAAEDPETGARAPNLVARFDQSFDWGAVNIRGLAHEKRVDGQSKRGYGVGVGGSYKISDKGLLMAQYTRVDGDIDNLYGSNGYFVDGSGQLAFDKNQGLVLGYARIFNEKLRGTLGYGVNLGDKSDGFYDNQRLQQLHINLIYSPIKNVELGGELVLGERKTFAGETGKMQRVDLMGRYSF
jgi:hypothetical protein